MNNDTTSTMRNGQNTTNQSAGQSVGQSAGQTGGQTAGQAAGQAVGQVMGQTTEQVIDQSGKIIGETVNGTVKLTQQSGKIIGETVNGAVDVTDQIVTNTIDTTGNIVHGVGKTGYVIGSGIYNVGHQTAMGAADLFNVNYGSTTVSLFCIFFLIIIIGLLMIVTNDTSLITKNQ